MRDVVEHGRIRCTCRCSPRRWMASNGPASYYALRAQARTPAFDWRDVKAMDWKQSGVTHFEWCHFFTQWGAKYAIRIYEARIETGSCCGTPPPRLPRTLSGLFGAIPARVAALFGGGGHRGLLVLHVSDEPPASIAAIPRGSRLRASWPLDQGHGRSPRSSSRDRA